MERVLWPSSEQGKNRPIFLLQFWNRETDHNSPGQPTVGTARGTLITGALELVPSVCFSLSLSQEYIQPGGSLGEVLLHKETAAIILN